ncbi:MAG: hypothetical protein M3P37_07480 [Actinomycetota bacterium]|nr:hypothetical protein [Actinomycetota bacterium]
MDVLLENWANVAIAAVNVMVFYFVLARLMGWRASIKDLRLSKVGR